MRKFLTFFKKVLISIAKLLINRWSLVPAIIVLLACVLFIALKSYIAPLPTDFNQRKEFIQLLAQILGGALLLIGLYLTWRRVEVAHEGQITERFTRAINQLGSNKIEIRLGGIYALERIARDSKRDHWQVMEVLTAYVRKNAPWKSKKKAISPTPADIQTILTVIGRREPKFKKTETLPLDLTHTDLRHAFLWGAHLDRTALWEVHLEEAVLINAHLKFAILSGAHLENTFLWEAHLENAFLISVHLENARLRAAHLENAFLWKAHLGKADLSEANLKGADLSGAKGLTKGQIKSAIIDENTKLPDYLQAPAKPKKRVKQEGKKKRAALKK